MYIDAPWLRSHRRSKGQVPSKLLPLLLLRSGFGCSYYWIQPQSDVWTFNPKGNAFAEEHSRLTAHRLKHHYLTLAKIFMHLLKLSWDRSVKKSVSAGSSQCSYCHLQKWAALFRNRQSKGEGQSAINHASVRAAKQLGVAGKLLILHNQWLC